MKKHLSKLISAIAITISTYYLWTLRNSIFQNLKLSKIPILLVFTVVFIILHCLKIFRIYTLMVEEKFIRFNKLLPIYLKTTFVSILIPFKLGEIYKYIEYGRFLKDYRKAFIIMVVDKVFDLIIILINVLLASFLFGSPIPMLSLVIMFILILIFISIYLFEPIYYYFNQIFIISKNNKQSLVILRLLEWVNHWYRNLRAIIRGRTTFLFLITILIWGIEFLLIYLTGLILNAGVSYQVYVKILNDIFVNSHSSVTNAYIFLSAIILMISWLIWKIFQGKGHSNE